MRALRGLPGVTQGRLAVAALKKSAGPMKEMAVDLAPERTGTIKRAMVIVQNSYEDLPGVMIAPTKGKKFQASKKDAWYARFQEYGTGGFGKRRRSLQSTSIDLKHGSVHRKYKTVGYKRHGGGLPAREFMKRAFEAKKDQFMANFRNDLSKITLSYLKRTLPSKYANRSLI